MKENLKIGLIQLAKGADVTENRMRLADKMRSLVKE